MALPLDTALITAPEPSESPQPDLLITTLGSVPYEVPA